MFGQWLVYNLDIPQDYLDQSQYVTLWCHQTLNIPGMMMMMPSGSSYHNIVNEYKYYFSHSTTTKPTFQHLKCLILELYSW